MTMSPTATKEMIKPLYGARLLPQVLDDLAVSDPERVYASFPISSDISQGFHDVTMREIANAVNNAAWWLEDRIGRTENFETLAYMGPTDLRYPVAFFAAVKCGYKVAGIKVLLPSSRNSAVMNATLLERTECTKLLFAPEMERLVISICNEQKDLQTFSMPSLDEMIRQPTKNYLFKKEFETAQWDPFLILHSSGSTGPPKPIVMNHGSLAVSDNDRNMWQVPGRKNQNTALWNFKDGGRYFSAFPPFHLAGVYSLIIIPVYSTTSTLVLSPPDRPPTGQLVGQIMKQCELRALFIPPSIAEQLVQEPEGLNLASKLDFIIYAGGPLTQVTGNALSKVTDLCQFYGSTETGPAQTLVPLRENWGYIEFHPAYKFEMRYDIDDAYEMILSKDDKLLGVRSFSHIFPDVEEWHTKDLFQRHPEKLNLWRFYGRTDDILVLSNGEKFNPVPSETVIVAHPLLSGALIVGAGRFQPALLVEPKQEILNKEEFIDVLWPTVQKANSKAPGHGRITRSLIVLTSPDKPLARAAKGTVIRNTTTKDYATELEALYSGADILQARDVLVLTAPYDLEAMKAFVHNAVKQVLLEADFSNTDDLYVLGLDSLKTTELVLILKVGLLKHYKDMDLSWLSSHSIYGNPKVIKLAAAIYLALNPGVSNTAALNGATSSRLDDMAAMVEKYTLDLPKRATEKEAMKKPENLTVIVTGTTGSLGTYLLDRLLSSPLISKVYAMNRSVDADARHKTNFATRNLPFEAKPPKLECLHAEFGSPSFGLPPDKLAEVTQSADIYLLNAWPVNFNQTLESFEKSSISAVRHFIDLAIASSRSPRIIFISSVSSVSNFPAVYKTSAPVPETMFESLDTAMSIGYGESKHVTERILRAASVVSSVPVTILRVGQVAGPTDPKAGQWNRAEWVYGLVKTAKALGMIPGDMRDIDWIPVDVLARIIMDVVVDRGSAQQSAEDGLSLCNLVNPKRRGWAAFADVLKRKLGRDATVVDDSSWLNALRSLDRSDPNVLRDKPAVEVSEFYEHFPRGTLFGTANSEKISESMRGLEPIGTDLMEMWIDQWGF